ncbi:hypothetical protein [Paenibacillus naphthalenovorans]|uniref:Uncharacterized protein n=1 Tax=Paenibacillus naphthalenovorans TaxID=162209 RepID=A0A0U2U772_9BACL|nr:hypothetical protein [Paenibacillus naphthalenovorans]ALS22217.1 hypothetical protein IJ22_18430 [Paenibacillus naphthalenovorans]
MKLFQVQICCSYDEDSVDSRLIVAEDKESAENKMKEIYDDFMRYFQWVNAVEINEVDGWKITISR